MLHITPTLRIDDGDIEEEFVRASGPGGQNVNKVATAVHLRFDVSKSPTLPDDVRARLTRLAGRRINKEGILIIRAHRFRTQEQNRRDALERLIGLIRSAAEKPRVRRKTKPTPASKERRLEAKQRRSILKRQRRSTPLGER